MSSPNGYLSPAVAGTGAIALGVASCASALGEVRVLARSDASAWKADERLEDLCARVDGGDQSRILVVEAIVEDPGPKAELLSTVRDACPDADLATTTSSLRISELAASAGVGERLYGLHVFNPVARMELIELCLPDGLGDGIAARARAFCDALGKRAVEVPDHPGFVVNRLLFPYLFDAVRLLDDLGLEPEQVDACMSLGANQPMGPLKLLDFVGIDVAVAIGESLHLASEAEYHSPPERLIEMERAGKLGRKSGSGFYDYD